MISNWSQRYRAHRDKLEQNYLRGRALPRSGALILNTHFILRTALRADILSKSAALSYTVVFSLVPLVTTLLAFLTAFPGLQNQREKFMGLLSGYLLPGAVQGVESKLAQFSDRAAAAGSLSSLIFFVLVLMLFQAMELAMNSIWDAERQRSWAERLRALAFFLILGGLSTTLFVYVREQAEVLSGNLPGLSEGIAMLAKTSVNLLVAWALFIVSIRFLPNVKMSWRSAAVGGVLAGTVWHFLKGSFTWYVENMANYSNIYGTLGVVPVFFLWIYLSFLVLLLSACVAYAVQNLENSIFKDLATERGYPRGFYAVLVAAEIARSFREGSAPVSSEEITRRLEVPSFCVADALQWLRQSGVVLLVTEEGAPRYMPARPGESISFQAIVSGVSGGDLLLPDTKSGQELYKRVERVFQEARNGSERVLEKHTLAEAVTASLRKTGS